MRNRTGLRDGRELHVLDVENLLGGTYFAPDDVHDLRAGYVLATVMSPDAQVVVGASANASAISGGVGWPGSGVRIRRGPNGADLALVEVLEQEDASSRFERIYIGSGDGIFAPVAAALAGLGVYVTVVSRRAALSGALRLACAQVIYLDVPEAIVARSRRAEAA